MDPFKINIDSEACKKLIDTVASGVGAVAGHWFTRDRAKANADSLRITAQAKKDAEDIANGKKSLDKNGNLVPAQDIIEGQLIEVTEDAGIEARLTYQEQKRQDNLIKIVYNAAAEMPENVSKQEVDPDWISRFFTYAQDVSTEEMQKIWAKILAGEVERPGSTSPRTLECLKNITKQEAEIFEKIKPFIIDNFLLKSVHTPREKYNIRFEELMVLQHAGLIDPNWSLRKIFSSVVPNEYVNAIPLNEGRILLVKHPERATAKVNISVIMLTQAGRELLHASGYSEINPEYFNEFLKHFDGFNTQVFDPSEQEKKQAKSS